MGQFSMKITPLPGSLLAANQQAAPQKLDLLRQIKSSFDPDWRMNPGCLLTKPTHLL
jgi:FAD/FMN-containing dehydrogenase